MIQEPKKATSSGEVEGKTAILVDDIHNTGKTFAEAAKILERGGVKDIYAVASHGLFAGGLC